MTAFVCQTHGVIWRETVENGRPVRRINYKGRQMPHGCALLRMTDPKELNPGDTYYSASTGRSAYSQCFVKEGDK